MLEECGIDYRVRPIALGELEQKEEWFLRINPDGRIPALTDHEHNLNVFESGAILVYLAGEYFIADVANFAWARTADWSGLEIGDLKHVSRWIRTVEARLAVQRGLAVPESAHLGKSEVEFVQSARRMLA